jgi:hypothetical protein
MSARGSAFTTVRQRGTGSTNPRPSFWPLAPSSHNPAGRLGVAHATAGRHTGWIFPEAPRLEAPAIPPLPKRKPPSQRPELKKDETAEAIALARAEAKSDKAEDEKGSRMVSDDLRSQAGSRAGEPARATKVAPAPQAKRPKSFG